MSRYLKYLRYASLAIAWYLIMLALGVSVPYLLVVAIAAYLFVSI
jgi:hypothetical protein